MFKYESWKMVKKKEKSYRPTDPTLSHKGKYFGQKRPGGE